MTQCLNKQTNNKIKIIRNPKINLFCSPTVHFPMNLNLFFSLTLLHIAKSRRQFGQQLQCFFPTALQAQLTNSPNANPSQKQPKHHQTPRKISKRRGFSNREPTWKKKPWEKTTWKRKKSANASDSLITSWISLTGSGDFVCFNVDCLTIALWTFDDTFGVFLLQVSLVPHHLPSERRSDLIPRPSPILSLKLAGSISTTNRLLPTPTIHFFKPNTQVACHKVSVVPLLNPYELSGTSVNRVWKSLKIDQHGFRWTWYV